MTLGSQTLTIANGSTTYAGIIGGTGGLSLTAGTETLSGINTYTGATTINGGTLALSGTGSIAASSQVNVADAAGTFSIAGTTAGATITTLNGVANSNVTLGAQTLTIANGSTTYAGIIGGTGGLTLTAGTETLSGTNTYTGATTINGGTLALSGTGSIAASSQVNLANAAGTFDIRAPPRCHHQDTQRCGQQQRDAGSQDPNDREWLDHLRGQHRRYRRTEPDGGHRTSAAPTLHRRHHHQRRHAGAERHRQHCGIEPGERSRRRHVQHPAPRRAPPSPHSTVSPTAM